MDIQGTIIAILPARSGISKNSGKEWMTQQYVIEVPGQYPKKMAFEVFGEDRIRQFNIQNQGQYNVSFDIDASEYQGRWYNTVRAYAVTPVAQPAATPPARPAAAPTHSVPPQPPLFPPEQNNIDDNLPF